MTTRQQKYKINRLAGMNQYNAARAAGYSETYSRQACRVEKLAKVSMADAFERAGLTDKWICEYAKQGMEANKVISCNVVAKNGEGMADAHGTTKDFIEVPDWAARHRFFETFLKLADKLKDGINIGNTSVFVSPNKTVVFKDIGPDEINRNNGRNNSCDAGKGAEGIGAESKI